MPQVYLSIFDLEYTISLLKDDVQALNTNIAEDPSNYMLMEMRKYSQRILDKLTQARDIVMDDDESRGGEQQCQIMKFRSKERKKPRK